MPFINVVQYRPSSPPYQFLVFFQATLIFLPTVILIYFSKSKSVDLENGYNVFLILFMLLVLCFFSTLLGELIQNLRFWLLNKQLKSKPIKLFRPEKMDTSNYFPYPPSTLILRERGTIYYPQKKGTFLILNSLPYEDEKIIEPYYRMILCKKLLNDEKILWHYFIIIFFLISLITATYSFTVAVILESLILKELLWLKILLLFTFLSVFFAYMLYKFIQNIPIKECSTSDIMHSITDVMSDAILDFQNKKDLDREFSIYENGEFFSQKEALDSIENIDDNIVDKLKNIFQITAPIFYLANITIGISYLIQNT